MYRNKIMFVISMLIVFGMLLAACAPARRRTSS